MNDFELRSLPTPEEKFPHYRSVEQLRSKYVQTEQNDRAWKKAFDRGFHNKFPNRIKGIIHGINTFQLSAEEQIVIWELMREIYYGLRNPLMAHESNRNLCVVAEENIRRLKNEITPISEAREKILVQKRQLTNFKRLLTAGADAGIIGVLSPTKRVTDNIHVLGSTTKNLSMVWNDAEIEGVSKEMYNVCLRLIHHLKPEHLRDLAQEVRNLYNPT